MDKRPILFIDSGIGGLTYCRDFQKKNPYEEICYLADRQNFPYGPRKKEELSSILIALTEKLLKSIDPKIIVLACNTATVSALEPLRQKFANIPFVGTVPAVKPAASASESGKIGILGTARTIEDPYSQHIAEDCETQNGNRREIFGVAAPELVDFVERRFDEADDNEKTQIVKKYVDKFSAEGIDTLVLGCTHFLYLLEEFRREASFAGIKVFDSLEGITKRIEFLLDEKNGALRAEIDFKPVHWLMLTGAEPASASWQDRSAKMGYALCMLDNL
ncbi:MAG: glutamate racemase [Treponema sp.]|nr:glutamate racemase [Treponema sp.]MCL2237319.1 glutamate racemase [Treponema sp.]